MSITSGSDGEGRSRRRDSSSAMARSKSRPMSQSSGESIAFAMAQMRALMSYSSFNRHSGLVAIAPYLCSGFVDVNLVLQSDPLTLQKISRCPLAFRIFIDPRIACQIEITKIRAIFRNYELFAGMVGIR